MFRAMVTDDEGKRVPLVRFNCGAGLFPYGPLPKKIQAAVRREVKREWRQHSPYRSPRKVVGGIVMALCFVTPTIYAFAFVPYAYIRIGPPWNVLVPMIPLVVAAGLYRAALVFTPFIWCDAVRRRAAAAAVSGGRCGSCGYPMLEQPAGTAGVCRCSECGAAWRRGGASG